MIPKISVYLPKSWDPAWTQGYDLVYDCSLSVCVSAFKELLEVRGLPQFLGIPCVPSRLALYLPRPLTGGHTHFYCFYLTF